MVNSEHHASIEMEKLAEYLGGKLETFQPLTRECSIYRVPERKRCLHPRDYTPKMVSIGPFHYGKPELKAMEEQKERYLKCFLQRTKENLLEIHISEAKHFLHLLMLCLHPSQMPDQVKLKNDDQNIPSVKELHEAGVKFKSGSSKNLIDIKFSDGILEIPFFTVYYYDTERMHGCPSYFNDYIIMMSCLVNTPKDAEFLIQNKIIGLGFSEILPSVFRSLDRDCSWDIPFKYSGVVADLQAYCQLPRHKWKANLKQNYFNTPWASISVIAAVILLLLTVTQTICSFIGL
ncbi:DUF862 domain-containing protein [Citrus sinensis]|nr:DUF862 domain-containing protein [Citrus sinensis]